MLFYQSKCLIFCIVFLLSRPDLRYLCFIYILVRSGCDLGGYSSVVCLEFCMSRVVVVLGVLYFCCPDMVTNQRQLFIVVSDWGSYLGFHFGFVGYCLCSCMSALVFTASRFVLLFC